MYFDVSLLSYTLFWSPHFILSPDGKRKEMTSRLGLTVRNNSPDEIETLIVFCARLPWFYADGFHPDLPLGFLNREIIEADKDLLLKQVTADFDSLHPQTEQTLWLAEAEWDEHHYYWLAPTKITGLLSAGRVFEHEKFLPLPDDKQDAAGDQPARPLLKLPGPRYSNLFTLASREPKHLLP